MVVIKKIYNTSQTQLQVKSVNLAEKKSLQILQTEEKKFYKNLHTVYVKYLCISQY